MRKGRKHLYFDLIYQVSTFLGCWRDRRCSKTTISSNDIKRMFNLDIISIRGRLFFEYGSCFTFLFSNFVIFRVALFVHPHSWIRHIMKIKISKNHWTPILLYFWYQKWDWVPLKRQQVNERMTTIMEWRPSTLFAT